MRGSTGRAANSATIYVSVLTCTPYIHLMYLTLDSSSPLCLLWNRVTLVPGAPAATPPNARSGVARSQAFGLRESFTDTRNQPHSFANNSTFAQNPSPAT